MAREQNVQQFDDDVDKFGSYVYAGGNRYSSVVATERQTRAIVTLLKTYFPGPIRILDY